MAVFTNVATLSYNGTTTNSNVVTGELRQVVSAAKNATPDQYAANDEITYVISLVNDGPTPFTGLTVTDSLGAYTFGADTVVPLTYLDGSVLYYLNGVLQPAPAVTAGPPLTFTGIAVPAGGSTQLVYRARINPFAPLAVGGSITNEATVSGGGLSADLVASETITAENAAALDITKSLSPAVVTENGQLTYTFLIRNTGNTAAAATDTVTLTDTFDPILDPITVTFNGTPWTEGVEYTYDPLTGAFATTPGTITVPAATYTQAADGSYVVVPGTATLVVTGTV